MIRAGHLLVCTAGVAALIAESEAQAQTQPEASAVLARACLTRPGQPISQADIAEALLIEAGISPTEFVRDVVVPASTTLAEANDAALVSRIRALLAGPRGDARSAINGGINNLLQRLNGQPESVTVENPNRQPITLFREDATPWRIVCKPPDPESDIEEPPAPLARFAVRETPEELWLTGRARRKAGALALGFERTRSELEDGTRKTETSFTIDGTAGLRLTPDTNRDFHAYLFATYNLQRDRTRPPPTLAADESESDGDTNVLALGLDGRFEGCLGGCSRGLPIDLNLQASTIFDFANDASRLRLKAIATPQPDLDLALCRIGSFSAGPLRGRCTFSAEVQAAHIMRRGATALGNYDTFVAAGGRARIEFFLPTRPGEEADTGFFASLNYRFLPVIHGAPDDIERFEAKIGHRFWTGADVGIDVGFTYERGTNELSFEEEDTLTFGLGLVY